MRAAYFYFLPLSVLLAPPCCAQDKTQKQSNILMIAIDDLNDWVGVLRGHPQARTPNIDRLAAKGVLFANAHAQAPICNPSRASIMTSLYPASTGIYFNTGAIQESPAARKNIVMPRRFEREGFHVSGAGKLFGGPQDEKYIPYYAGSFGGFGPLPEKKLSAFDGVRLWDWGAYPDRDEEMPDYKVATWAVEQLQAGQSQPFFLAVGFYRPHVPLYAPQEWLDKYPLESIQLPSVPPADMDDLPPYVTSLRSWEDIYVEPTHDWIVKHNQWRRLVQAYLASVTFVDHQIGRVLDALEKSHYSDNTQIVLFSDHGFHLGEKQAWGKQTLWEVSTRVPMIVAGPGIGKGKVCMKPVQLLDIYPTLLELAGLEADPSHEGHSLVPLLEDPRARWPHMARTGFGPGNEAVRSERYRYIHYNDGSEEFYDHRHDPHEWHNQCDNPMYNDIIQAHRSLIPQKNHPVVGEGSTGHKVYSATEALRK